MVMLRAPLLRVHQAVVVDYEARRVPPGPIALGRVWALLSPAQLMARTGLFGSYHACAVVRTPFGEKLEIGRVWVRLPTPDELALLHVLEQNARADGCDYAGPIARAELGE